MFLSVCEKSAFLEIILFAKEAIEIIKLIVPIILILMCAVDLGKIMLNAEEKKSIGKLIKRAIAAVAIFFIPTIVSLLLNMIGTTNYTMTSCWTNAETSKITSLKAQEKAEKEAAKKAIDEKQKEEKEKKEELDAAREEIRKKNEELTEESGGDKEIDVSDVDDPTFLKENGTDGMVTVIDGVFYKPASGTSGADGTKGSGDYGYNIYFLNRLKLFVAAAKENGHTINYSTTEYGAWRPYSNQLYFWNCYQTKTCNNGNLAAYPGSSNHGWGIASDLSFGSQSAIYWAHDHASEFGLKFPLCQNVRGSCQENWHIEPADLRKK